MLSSGLDEFDVIPSQDYSPLNTVTANLLDNTETTFVNTFSTAPAPTPAESLNAYIMGAINSTAGVVTVDPTAVQPTPNLHQSVNSTVSQIGNALGNAGGSILGNLLNNFVDGLGGGVKSSVGGVGATVATATLKEWFKRNWMYVTGGVIFLFGGIWYFAKRGNKTYKRR